MPPNDNLVQMPIRSPFAGRWLSKDSAEFAKSTPDPLAVVVPYLERPPEWLVMGGLGDSDEAWRARERWPTVKILGIDPDPRAMSWQLANRWPTDAPLLRRALSDRCGVEKIFLDTICCASLHPIHTIQAPSGALQDVLTTTLDVLDEVYGPFQESVLWLDLEGYDYKALLGARQLLKSGRVTLIGVEIKYELEDEAAGIEDLLGEFNYCRVLKWFAQWWGHNELWMKS